MKSAGEHGLGALEPKRRQRQVLTVSPVIVKGCCPPHLQRFARGKHRHAAEMRLSL